MTWKIKQKKPYEGNFRYVRRFALFPIRAGQEVKWLEVCYIRQRRWISWGAEGWENDKFIDKSMYKGYCHLDSTDNDSLQ